MNIDEMIGNDKMHSFCLPIETCVVCGDRASGGSKNNSLSHLITDTDHFSHYSCF